MDLQPFIQSGYNILYSQKQFMTFAYPHQYFEV